MPHRAGEITYYDELGVAPDASPEQIRDSFRSLVRLLHPDQQTDEQLKEIAERQMRKLNRIHAVLSDPDRRRRYDDSLEEDHRPPTIIFSPSSEVNVRRLMARFAWAAAIAIAFGVLIWLASSGPVAPPVQQPDRGGIAQRTAPAGASAGDPAAELEELRTDLRIAQAERDAAIRELARARDVPSKARSSEPSTEAPLPARPPLPLSTAMTELPSPPRPRREFDTPPSPVEKPARDAPALPAKAFAGFWFYSRPAQAQHMNSALYPPEFIETTISEQGGAVRGKYRARYQIVDRAIAPDVNFEFTGTPDGLVLVCPWTGPGGAKGQITLKITSENAMQIDWNTSRLGAMQELVTGTARLTRRID